MLQDQPPGRKGALMHDAVGLQRAELMLVGEAEENRWELGEAER